MFESEISFLKRELPLAFQTADGVDFSVSPKGKFDVVTTADREIERILRKKILTAFPGDRVLGEEYSPEKSLSDRTWILDPIDGTWNYSAGSPLFGVQCAFWHQGVAACCIYLPRLGEIYTAVRGEGAWCNGKRLRVTKRPADQSILSFGDLSHTRPHDAADQKRIMERYFPKIARYRMFGASSVDYAFTASSRIDGTVLFTKNVWDLACGVLLCREAGCLVLDEKGREYDFSSRGICIYSSRELFHELES